MTDQAAGTAGMKLVERPEPQGVSVAWQHADMSEERYENRGCDSRYANVLLVQFGNKLEKLWLPQSKHIVTRA